MPYKQEVMKASEEMRAEQCATHSPAPWRVGDAGTAVFAAKNGHVPKYIASDLTRADARLIAAAPDLLKVCVMLCQLDEAATKRLEYTQWGKDTLLAAHSAIAKVNG